MYHEVKLIKSNSIQNIRKYRCISSHGFFSVMIKVQNTNYLAADFVINDLSAILPIYLVDTVAPH